MNETDLCERIKDKLEQQGIDISMSDIKDLYINTLSSIEEVLKDEQSVDVSNFGSFWRKDGESSSLTFFKPAEALVEKINSR